MHIPGQFNFPYILSKIALKLQGNPACICYWEIKSMGQSYTSTLLHDAIFQDDFIWCHLSTYRSPFDWQVVIAFFFFLIQPMFLFFLKISQACLISLRDFDRQCPLAFFFFWCCCFSFLLKAYLIEEKTSLSILSLKLGMMSGSTDLQLATWLSAKDME